MSGSHSFNNPSQHKKEFYNFVKGLHVGINSDSYIREHVAFSLLCTKFPSLIYFSQSAEENSDSAPWYVIEYLLSKNRLRKGIREFQDNLTNN